MRGHPFKLTEADVENAQSGRRIKLGAIQGIIGDAHVGLVSARHLNEIYPSGVPSRTRFAQFEGSDEVYLIIESGGCFAPEFDSAHDPVRILRNTARERSRIQPSVLLFWKRRRLPVMPQARLVRRAQSNPVRPGREGLSRRQIEIIDFIKKNRPSRKRSVFDRLGAFLMHPVVRLVGGILILAVFYLIFRRPINTLFDALSHFPKPR